MRRDGTELRQITSDEPLDRVPRWSPDGQWLLFFSNRMGILDLWRIRPDGSDLQQLTQNANSSYPVWSPDGSRIATGVVGGVRPGQTHSDTFIFDPLRAWTDQTPQRLPPLDAPSPVFIVNGWSPDGTRLAGTAGLTPPLGIVVYSFASQTYEPLTDFGEWPMWFPDGRQILFVSGGKDFHVVDSRSKEVRKIYSTTRDVLGPPRMTREGREAYFSRRTTESDVWLATLQ